MFLDIYILQDSVVTYRNKCAVHAHK